MSLWFETNVLNHIRAKRIPDFYPSQMQGKIIEADYRIVRIEFLAIKDILSLDKDTKLRYKICLSRRRTMKMKDSRINGLTPS